MSKIIGIDLGTTNSVAAVMEGGNPVVITTAEGTRLLPSVVAFTKSGERLVGQTAKRQAVVNPENTVYSIKRFMGRRYDEVDQEREIAPFKVVKGPAGDARVFIPATDKEYTPQEISAMILGKLKADAEAYLGEKVTQAVITVPAYFNDSQRQATKDAGKIAGLEVMRIINEPTASALAYGLDKKKNEKVLVFDLGGGTFDVSVLEVGDGVFEVKSTAGATHLGGGALDQKLVTWAIDAFQKEQGMDLSKDRQALQRLREAAEKAKIELSTMMETELNLPYITADATGPKHLQLKITRAKFEQMTKDLVDRTRIPFERALKDAGLTAKEIDEVVLVGGSSRMPMVQDMVRSLINKEPNKSVNPDEVVAIGAAIQGGVLGGEVKDVVLLDVTPLTLGVETMGGVMTPIIERNTTIPVRRSQTFSTAEDNQSAVDINVLQGERQMAADNNTLGRFRLEGIPPAPRGLPQIEVTFDMDSNGILNVTAKDKASGKEQKVTITASTNLDKSEVERMVNEAKSHEADDRKRRELVDARNAADNWQYQIEKTLSEKGAGVPIELRTEAENLLNQAKQLTGSDELSRITNLNGQMEQFLGRLMQAGPAPESAAGPTTSEPQNPQTDDDNVVEGEFKDT
ncbi:MAG TPA: molecular chaperone DnaK [Bellilinea sp.]|nr:molecular chaperone DnaK [Bellilinea sp.]